MQISFHVDSSIKIEKWNENIFPASGCLSVNVVHSMRQKWGDSVYSADEISLHGTREQVRAFCGASLTRPRAKTFASVSSTDTNGCVRIAAGITPISRN